MSLDAAGFIRDVAPPCPRDAGKKPLQQQSKKNNEVEGATYCCIFLPGRTNEGVRRKMMTTYIWRICVCYSNAMILSGFSESQQSDKICRVHVRGCKYWQEKEASCLQQKERGPQYRELKQRYRRAAELSSPATFFWNDSVTFFPDASNHRAPHVLSDHCDLI